MKVTVLDNAAVFRPITIEVKLETKADVESLYRAVDGAGPNVLPLRTGLFDLLDALNK